MSVKTPLILATVSALALVGCVNNDPFGARTEDNQRTQAGMVTGAMVGAALGAVKGKGSTLTNVAAGAALGGLIGGGIGNMLDAQAAELRRTVGNDRITITNTGSELIVNMPHDILFAVDSATLQPALYGDLAAVARSLMNYPGSTVQVIGHTDSTGSASYNNSLSQRRAASVATVLIQDGVPAARIQTIGRGASQPIASNQTEQGRAQNRRVEIIIRPTA